jgi:hypothetical protein
VAACIRARLFRTDLAELRPVFVRSLLEIASRTSALPSRTASWRWGPGQLADFVLW